MNRKKASLKVRDFELNIKAVDDNGFFSGYGSVFGNADSYGEVVMPGAFSKSLERINANGRKVPVLWQHRQGEPIGVYTKLEEDDRGLYVEGRLLKDSVRQAGEAHALMQAEAVSGLSIGYYVMDDTFDEVDRVRRLKELDLMEISLVTFPANDEARIEAVKFAIAHGDLPSLPDFERLLREAGFSKSQSAVIANRGLSHLLRSESAGEAKQSNPEDLKALENALAGFSLPKF
ncbi:HK97 family phage prohead protease [Kushneria konosiri]|uniref:Peptidase U35 n=1 Tax=Kushneria konosiri TaxID=698828 RepID=A0A2Z2H336_9GAMM|nr:HK97 family phage prohead protease [Kushneria konosiri]ARS51508.1 peptidase U35 [Kushneria konosiri]